MIKLTAVAVLMFALVPAGRADTFAFNFSVNNNEVQSYNPVTGQFTVGGTDFNVSGGGSFTTLPFDDTGDLNYNSDGYPLVSVDGEMDGEAMSFTPSPLDFLNANEFGVGGFIFGPQFQFTVGGIQYFIFADDMGEYVGSPYILYSPSLNYSRFCWQKKKRCSKRLMNTGF
jgi:hypothetical protein